MIRRGDGTIYYIGQASNLAERIRAHRKDFRDVEWFTAWQAIETCFTREAYDLLREMERAQIKRHDPEGNRVRGGAGRPPRTEECPLLWPCRDLGECRRSRNSS